ncbi:MAG: nucleotide sugar dehydrogenase [Deltaproteobacteria bacterium RIFCSPHIGHO2_02_FULL_40_11]|nr:MAG: nucleotide sugar dehydrogenase [Deltaproteobacteria bacterium RIFCSPHIGHO2_02_FULL_40_11]
MFDISIIGGCGHVGFPLGLSFAKAGFSVGLLDVNQKAIDQINQGQVPFKEEGAEALLKEILPKKKLTCTNDPKILLKSKCVILVTGTPLDEYLNPKLNAITKVIEEYLPYFKDGQLIILRSTIYPKTSQKIDQYFKSKNLNVHLTFCPERVTEGYALSEIKNIPQIVSGFSPEGIERASALFSKITKKIIHMQPLEAELVKLFSNAYRYIHFGISNQFYMLAEEHGVDFGNIYHAMTDEYPRMKGFPRPGFTAGPCLLKDTMQLCSFSQDHFHLGHAARLVNEHMPIHLVNQMKSKISLEDKTVGILGMTFKPESDDPRESLSYKLKHLLEMEAKHVLCSDEYMKHENFCSKENLIESSDVIVIGTPHEAYQTLDFKNLPVFSVWLQPSCS